MSGQSAKFYRMCIFCGRGVGAQKRETFIEYPWLLGSGGKYLVNQIRLGGQGNLTKSHLYAIHKFWREVGN